ncbi:hypothetical protein [Terrabacter sp. MAHUQ-38]|uniref:hypothetical protein n=1 Tax=unclassified Terrabacter TaxID=2630222 RepID=UPI00165EB0CE|nr:hypothetical protein [Terrabacter sp. MAHUQ-38]MBC9822151.1 hypothetical protein [Terrabacter sp. MAHUQ-38]
MKGTTRFGLAGLAAASAIVLAAGPSLATECVNASKPSQAGIQVLLGPSGIEWSTAGVATRISQGLIDPDTGAGFHGLIGFDFDGDGTVDFQTFVVGRDDEIPELAQFNGPSCHGITNVAIYFAECV